MTSDKQIRVLLVEDNPVDAQLVEALADRSEGAFMTMATVGTLGEALQMLRKGGFDAVLLDLHLPDARGLETVERIQAEIRDIAIVVLTVSDDEALALRAVQMGAQDYLIKARISPEVLFRSIKYAIERYRREAAEATLLHAQKMEAVGQLAGGVAHEFNNMLHTITGTAALMLMDLPEKDPLRRDVATIEQAANRAAGLTQQLLAFGRKQILQSKVVDLNEIVSRMEPLLGQVIEENVRVVVEPAPEPALIRVDPASIEQVILNLATNGRDAMPGGGTLTISTRIIPADTESDAEGDDSEGLVELAVRDTGDGMDGETRERIFDPFFTTKAHGKGTGLGLSTVYGIVQQSGGDIQVETAPGRGAEFFVSLPQVDAEAAVDRTEPAESRAATGTVLVAEDEAAVRRLVVRILERGGYEVLGAAGPDEAVGVSESFDGAIDVLVTDVVMPGANGPELAARLASSRPRMPVIYMSGYPREHIDPDNDLGPDAILLAKPFSPADLLRTVQGVIARAASSGPVDRS